MARSLAPLRHRGFRLLVSGQLASNAGAVVVHSFGPALLFPLAAAVLAVAIVAGLSQRSWRELGAVERPRPASTRPRPRGAGQPALVSASTETMESAA
jgi:hypothetical protein